MERLAAMGQAFRELPSRLQQDDMLSYLRLGDGGDEEVRQGLKTFSNWPTYPQLYSSGKLVGGLDIMKELHESGDLAAELPAAARPPA